MSAIRGLQQFCEKHDITIRNDEHFNLLSFIIELSKKAVPLAEYKGRVTEVIERLGEESEEWGGCPRCGTDVYLGLDECPVCGLDLKSDDEEELEESGKSLDEEFAELDPNYKASEESIEDEEDEGEEGDYEYEEEDEFEAVDDGDEYEYEDEAEDEFEDEDEGLEVIESEQEAEEDGDDDDYDYEYEEEPESEEDEESVEEDEEEFEEEDGEEEGEEDEEIDFESEEVQEPLEEAKKSVNRKKLLKKKIKPKEEVKPKAKTNAERVAERNARREKMKSLIPRLRKNPRKVDDIPYLLLLMLPGLLGYKSKPATIGSQQEIREWCKRQLRKGAK